MKRAVVLWGGGGHAKACIEIMRAEGKYDIAGIVDANMSPGRRVLDVPVLGGEELIEQLPSRGVTMAFLAIGAVRNHPSRTPMFNRLMAAGYQLPPIVHPRSVVDASAVIGEGTVVFPNLTISADARIGRGCILGPGVVVSHDCVVGDNVHIAPGTLLAGGVSVGDDSLIGMGVAVYIGVRIGRRVRINNGTVINGHVPDDRVVLK